LTGGIFIYFEIIQNISAKHHHPEKININSSDNSSTVKQRFDFIDQFRGFIIILMLVDHCSYYLNSIWKYLDPFDPLFASWDQFALRYVGYLCAPGFLIINGAMVWWSYNKRKNRGIANRTIRLQLIQRGLFLVVLQMIWVNSSWGGFSEFQPWHLGIIACIGISMILQSFCVHLRWEIQLIIGLFILLLHPFLLRISYNANDIWSTVLMQTFIDSGEFNKYPVLPWFALALLGSVMAHGWLKVWDTDRKRIVWSLGIGSAALIIATALRLLRGYGNIFPFSDFGSYSFFFDQKYPPSLFFSIWFFGSTTLVIGIFIAINKFLPKLFLIFNITGKVALFFYCLHIAILGVFSKRIDLFYREGEVATTLIGVIIMMIVMLPLSKWFYRVKSSSKNIIIKMM
jgi:uncharacterized membrane protein